MIQQINDCVKQGASFAFETTLSGKGYAEKIRGWKPRIYKQLADSWTLFDTSGNMPVAIETSEVK